MPAKSKSQRKLMQYAYACKVGKAKNCPSNIMKVGSDMSTKQLKDFFEGIIYKTKKSNQDSLKNFLVWLDGRKIEYIYDEESGELEIYNEFDLSKDDNRMLLQYAAKLNLEKIWEKGEYVYEEGEGGTTMASLGNVTGQGSVAPAARTMSGSGGVEFRGSGDRFDNFDDEDDDDADKKKLKAKKRKEAIEDSKKRKSNETEKGKNRQRGKMESLFIDIDTFDLEDVLTIDERLTAKRKYTEKHPSVDMNYSAPIRNKVLAFVSKKKEVSEEALKQFFGSLEEELGKQPDWGWVSNNKHLIKKFEGEKGTTYKLTERGIRVLSRYDEFNKKG